ncbi:hypothetical protein C2759_03595 [Polynucleobacter sp. MG-Unter2-18]|uniref:hypothetical protein n=1 Tax=Polynucleobacter sp. MG-Unter2-18 TaxID=2081052 RepID=UPI001BFD2371|nr:hypothetical protein [Polynucleobacter sp. MG-Unter2-18]QWD95227.1 hypothetical protein C2759_03595 [Polynucleobacter sp. MG-Unter2-18]
MGISEQIGFGPKAFKKLQSCFVAAEAACSKGDLPVVTVETALTAVEGLATAADTTTEPAELAAVVADPPKAINGAAQPPKLRQRTMYPKANHPDRLGLL